MRWNWGWTPFVVIGAAAIANAVMITTSLRVRPESVEANPFMASRQFDAERIAMQRFSALGLRLEAATNPGGALLTMAGPAPSQALVDIYRPSDASLDQRILWQNTAESLPLELAAGPWRITLSADSVEGELRTITDIVVP